MLAIKLKIIAFIISALGILGLGYLGYSYVYNKGKTDAEQACYLKQLEYQAAIQKAIGGLENNISKLSVASIQQNEQLAEDISQILAGVKKMPVVVVKNGKCIPSETFVDGINQAIDRANKK